jgi:type II secretory pathway pseudopilin PulG
MLVAVIFLVMLLTIALAVALPKVSKQIQRDRELETMHRGKQYIRAIRMYYKKFGGYPPNPDILYKPTNNIRFLRKKYSDPTTGKEEWRPIGVGQNRAPTVMGFFGQPLGGTGGCAPNPSSGGSSSSPSSSTTFGPSPSTGGGTPGSSTGGSAGCANLGLNPSTGTPNSPGGTNSTDSNASNTTGSTSGLGGQTYGGGPIMGFSPNSPKKSIMIYKTKSHYNEWEFVYDPIAEQMLANGGMAYGMAGGVPGGGMPQPAGQAPGLTPTPTPTPSPSQ